LPFPSDFKILVGNHRKSLSYLPQAAWRSQPTAVASHQTDAPVAGH